MENTWLRIETVKCGVYLVPCSKVVSVRLEPDSGDLIIETTENMIPTPTTPSIVSGDLALDIMREHTNI